MTEALLLATVRGRVIDYLEAFLEIYGLIILAYVVSSLFFGFGGRIPYSRWSNAVLTFLRDVSEPLLGPIRRVLPRFGPFDFSPIVALLLIGFLRGIIGSFR